MVIEVFDFIKGGERRSKALHFFQKNKLNLTLYSVQSVPSKNQLQVKSLPT